MRTSDDYDVVVIGAGFGGLATALELSARGARVALCETLRYPGGCASTYTRRGCSYESGATLFSGFAPGQLFHTWMETYAMDVTIDWLDPMVELRTADLNLPVSPRREELIERFMGLPGAPREGIQAFFSRQERVADVLWELLKRPELLPPFKPSALVGHARRLGQYLPLLRWMGRPLIAVMRDCGVADFEPLRIYLDALCQITVQCGVEEAEALFAMSTMDYYFRGTGHVRGWIGELAWALSRAIESNGGDVIYTNRVKGARRGADGRWVVEARRGELTAPFLVANLLPHNIRDLLGLSIGDNSTLDRLASAVEGGWGAAMLYLTARPPEGASPHAHHLELIQDPGAPFMEGNHLFCSISGEADEGRAPGGLRTITISTHIPWRAYAARSAEEQADYIRGVQATMREGFEALAPKWAAGVESEMPASPRTFERFTGRHGGLVGGIPRRAGIHNYRDLLPQEPAPGLFMVGDTVFPGQSTLATAIGGVKVAEHIARKAGFSVAEGRRAAR